MAEREIPAIIPSKQVLDDDILEQHVKHSLSLGLPSLPAHHAHDLVAVLVASGPSVEGQLDSIRRQRDRGRPIIAIKDAHDFLIEHDIIPNQAVVLDPTETQWQCFRRKRMDVQYWCASYCHPSMFEHLKGHQVSLFHLLFNDMKAYKGTSVKFAVGGWTTTGLRTINVMYEMGFRRFELYGYDSCLMDGQLRVSSAWERPEDKDMKVVYVTVGGRKFACNPAMAVQAKGFQDFWTVYEMPDVFIQAYGDGLIAAILDERAKQRAQRGRQPQMEVVCQ